jgi:nitroreductase
MKNDGALTYNGRVTNLMKVMLARRSFRKYSPGAVTDEQLAYLQAVAEQARTAWNCPAAEIRIERGRERFIELSRQSTRGLLGFGNKWLSFCQAEALILVVADEAAAPTIEGRRTAVSQAAMVMEAVVLAAAELGLATCWMAALSYEHLARAGGVEKGKLLIAASPLGLPPKRMSLSFDMLANRVMSSKRKPIGEIAFSGRIGREAAL